MLTATKLATTISGRTLMMLSNVIGGDKISNGKIC